MNSLINNDDGEISIIVIIIIRTKSLITADRFVCLPQLAQYHSRSFLGFSALREVISVRRGFLPQRLELRMYVRGGGGGKGGGGRYVL